MLPLEGVFLIPSLIVVPAALLYLLATRSRPSYPRFWTFAAVTCFVLSAFFSIQILKAPLYSEQLHHSDPAGPPGGLPGILVVAAVLVLGPCLMIPAFFILILLGCLPPVDRPRHPPLIASVLYVGILAVLLLTKNNAYMADYRFEKSKPRQTPFERFKHLRENTDAASGTAPK